MIERIGKSDFKMLLEDFTIDQMFEYYYQFYERMVHVVFPVCSKTANKRIDKIFSIVDLKDAKLLSMLKSKPKEFLQKYTFLSQNFFPEMLEKLIIINAPIVFKGVWNVVKYWVDKKTRKKIEIHWGSPKEALLKYIDEDKLFYEFGGKCRDSIFDNKGPWERVYQKSLREGLFYLEEEAWEKYFLTEEERLKKKTLEL